MPTRDPTPPRPAPSPFPGILRLGRLRRERPVTWVAATAALLALVAGLAPYRATLDEVHVVLPMLLLILIASSFGGELLGFFLAAIGFLAIDIVFQRPFDQFSLRKPHDASIMLSFFVTAAVATRLLARARYQATEARRRSREVQRMADLGAEMLSALSPAAALERVAVTTCEVLGARRCVIRRGEGEGGVDVARAEVPAAPAAASASRRVRGTARLPETVRLPLYAEGGVIGEIVVEDVSVDAMRDARATTLQALAQYAALGLDRMRLAADAAHANALREADRMKDMVLASVSHDLRTPLTTIKLLAASLAGRGEGPAQQIEEEADRLSRMVGDLLDLSRARAGELSLAMDVNTLEDLVGAAMRQLAPLLGTRQVVRRVADDEGPLVGRFDFVASLRVLVNLLENAHKYSPPDQPIELVARRDGRELVIEVRDRGPGIADDDLAQIYIPFFRSKRVRYDVGGAGLGLPMGKTLAEAQGGGLRYSPREGGGSVFTFTLVALDEPLTSVLDESQVTGEG